MLSWFSNKKQKVLLLDETWVPMGEYKVTQVPKRFELIFIHELGKYFEVLNIIHGFIKNDTPSIILVLKEYINSTSIS